MEKFGKLYIYAALVLLILLPTLNAVVDTVVVQLNGESPLKNYDHAVIGRTYNLFVGGNDLQSISHPELTLVSNDGSLAVYTFNANNTVGVRTFGDGSNQFQLSVISEADELADSIGSVIIEINDYSSSVQVNDFDLSDKIIRNVNLSGVQDLGNFQYNLPLNQLLDGLTFDLGFVKGERYPQYNNLFFSGTASNVLGAVLAFNQLEGKLPGDLDVADINANPILLNQVIDAYNATVKYAKNATAVKSGNDFFFSTDEGYANLNGLNLSDNPLNVSLTEKQILENIYSLIDDNVKFITPNEIVEALLPLGNFSNFTEFVDFNRVGINYSNLEVQDGEYTLKILYEDKFGNQGEMPFILRLDITNDALPETSDSDGTVVFNDTIVKQTLQRVENLPSGVSLAAVLYGSNNPSGFLNVPSNVNALNYMEITPNINVGSGSYDLYFKILKASIPLSAKNDVRLYVRDESSWTLLPTSLFNETSTHYEYKSTIPHFSQFLIGYVLPSGGGSGSSSGAQNYQFGGTNDTSGEEAIPGPINIGGPGSPEESPGFFATITGAVIGALSTPGGIVFVVVVIVGVVGLMIVLRAGRKARIKKEKGKKEKLNSRGDEIDES